MRFGSVCSGIEAASVAWEPLGWQAAWLAEIEPFPSAVLAHHYPTVPNLGDMTSLPERIMAGEVEAPDLFCGGTPCQAFSVAGLRRSLDDARGNLSLTFCEIANAIDVVRVRAGKPASIVFWENVPGVLSTKDNAFGCFLAGLAGEDDPIEPPGKKWSNAGCVLGPQRAVAWRVLDAQYFGVAQRRRRVFVVASARNDFDPAAVLFEWDSLRRDTAPRREAGQKPAGTIEASLGRSRGAGTPVSAIHAPDIARCIATREGSSQDWETTTIVAQPVAFHPTQDPISSTSVCHSIGANANATAAVAYALQHAQIGRKDSAGPQGKGWQEEVAFTQDSRSCADAVAVAYDIHGVPATSGASETSVHVPLRARQPGQSEASTTTVIQRAMQVRRLTPTECERLQGFPDGYTAIPWRGKPADQCPDGPRYKALGNSWAVPNVRWIGRRISLAISLVGEV